jgi:outer membrane immunogenic protein
MRAYPFTDLQVGGYAVKKLLLCTVFGLTVAASSAFAADLSYPVKAPPIVIAPAYSWTGFYLGANAGGGWGDFDTWQGKYSDGSLYDEQSWSHSAGGFIAGGQIGYNYQFSNNVVVGLEADIEWSDIDATTSGEGNGHYSYGSEVEWFGTLRARLGYAFDTLLVYGTGGAAYGKVKMFDNNWSTPDDYSYSDTRWGWTVGGGVEWAFAQNWSVKAEYLYVDLGTYRVDDFYPDWSPYTVQETDFKFHTLKVGINYKF